MISGWDQHLPEASTQIAFTEVGDTFGIMAGD